MPGLQLLPIKPVGTLKPLAVQAETPLVYQPYFNEQQRGELSPACEHLNAVFNTGTTAREYELFQHLHDRHRREQLPLDRFWGLVSRKFDLKSPIPVTEFLARANEAQNAGYDAFILNPMIGTATIHANVWEQGAAHGHPGMLEVQNFLQEKGFPVSIIQGEDSFTFCNYMCGNAHFWNNYFFLIENVLSLLEAEGDAGTPIGQIYRGGAAYSRDLNATMRPFVIERLLSCFLTIARNSGAVKVAMYAPTLEDFDYKFGPRLAAILHPMYELKNRATSTADGRIAQEWIRARELFQQAPPYLLWMLDDPPDWMPIAHRAA